MTASKPKVDVVLTIGRQEGQDDGQLDRAARDVLAELRELDLESAGLANDGVLPPGAKAGEAVLAGCIAVQLLPVVVPKLVEFLGRLVERKRETIEARFKLGAGEATIKYTPGVTSTEDVAKVLALLRESVGEQKRVVVG